MGERACHKHALGLCVVWSRWDLCGCKNRALKKCFSAALPQSPFSMTLKDIRVAKCVHVWNCTCAALAVHSAQHTRTLPDPFRSMARPHGHRSSSPPLYRRRLLARRPLDLCLSQCANTLTADHHANNTATVESVGRYISVPPREKIRRRRGRSYAVHAR